MTKPKRKQVIQGHHIQYDPPLIVPIFKSEHWAATNLDRRKQWSLGFITHLFDRILKRIHDGSIVDLSKEIKENKEK